MNSKFLLAGIIIAIVIGIIISFSISDYNVPQSIINDNPNTESGTVVVRSLNDGISTSDKP